MRGNLTFVLDQFFIPYVPANAEIGLYNGWLVAFSYILASLASYIAFVFSARMLEEENEKYRHIWRMGGAFAMGVGIWSMHFVGMIAYKMQMAMTYDVSLTVLSLLIAFVVAYRVLGMVRTPRLLRVREILPAAALLGIGISAMHYTGMAAMTMDGDIRYLPELFALSIVIAMTASGVALWLLSTLTQKHMRHKKLLIVSSSLLMGIAICGMHYTGIAATVFIPYADCRYDPEQNFETLLTVVGAAAIFLLVSVQLVAASVDALRKHDLGQRLFLQLAAALSVLFAATFLSLSYVGSLLDSWPDDPLRVNATNLQRLLIQRYSHSMEEAIIHADRPESGDYREPLEAAHHTAGMIGQNFTNFQRGGVVFLDVDGRETVDLRAVTYPEMLEALHDGKMAWRNLEQLSETILSDANQQVEDRHSLAHPMTPLTDVAVRAQDKFAGLMRDNIVSDIAFIKNGNLFVLVISALCFCGTIYYVYYRIARPFSCTAASLRDTVSRLKTILDVAFDGLIIINTRGIMQDCNLATEHLFGYSRDELIGKNVNMLMPNPHHDNHDLYVSRYLKTGKARIIGSMREVEGLRKDGTLFPFELGIKEIQNENEHLFVGIIHDISAQRYAEITKAAQSEFLSNMSHELRTPMHAILNYADMGLKQLDKNEPERLVKYLGNIRIAGDRLLKLLNNLLDLAKLEAKGIEFKIAEGDLKAVIGHSQMEIDSLLKAKNLTLDMNYVCEKTIAAFDRERLIQVLINLLSNAIKFSPEHSTIRIVVADAYLPDRNGDSANPSVGALCCSVENDGPCIPEDELEKIFDKFTQSRAIKKGAGGTGLGLSINREIIEAHGGRIWAENLPNRGVVFRFLLPKLALATEHDTRKTII